MAKKLKPVFSDIESFVKALSEVKSTDKLNNFYADVGGKEAYQASNLRHYLNALKQFKPKMLLLGEAPGYRGCALSGVPFCSLKTLENLSHFWEFPALIPEQEEILSELSADVVFGMMIRLKIKPVIWNALCFHPHDRYMKQTNRTPTRVEVIEYGKPFLLGILELFNPKYVVCVGRTAQNFVNKDADIAKAVEHRKVLYVRHPSFGGTRIFNEGMQGIVESLRENKTRL